MNIRIIFLSYNLLEYVENGYKEPIDATTLTDAQKLQLKEHRKKDAKALALI